jgi:arabinofuranosyltransferase
MQQCPDGSAQTNLRLVSLLVVSAGFVHAMFVVRVGGDFMHGRMLLPALFTVLLPMSVVLITGARWLLVGAITVWALACAFSLRTPYSGPAPAGPVGAYAAINHRTGIGDERLYYARVARSAHPVTIDDYLRHSPLGQAGRRTRALAQSGHHGLLVHALLDQTTLLPLRHGVHAVVVASAPALGVYGYAAGDAVDVVDDHGLADSLAAHQQLLTRGRPGHEKNLPEAWLLARWASPASPVPATVSRADVVAARHALRCGPLAELLAATTGPMDASRALKDLLHSLTFYRFRFATNPKIAERELCRR